MAHTEPLYLNAEQARALYDDLATAIEWHREQIKSLREHRDRMGTLAHEIGTQIDPAQHALVRDGLWQRILAHTRAADITQARQATVAAVMHRCLQADRKIRS